MLRAFAALSLAFCLSGCSNSPRLDATSDQTVQASITEMRDQLPDARTKREFAVALSSLEVKGKSSQAEAYKSLDGLTAQQIINRAPSK